MQVLDVQKVVGNLPSTLAPNTFYAVRVGAGYDLYLSDSTGAVAHRLNADFSGLAVGGRNLLRNTGVPTTTNPICHNTTTAPRVDGLTVNYDNGVLVLQATKSSNRFAFCTWSDKRLDLEPNTSYVLSGFVKAQTETTLSARWFKFVNRWISQIINFNATTEWTKFVVKFAIPDEAITGSFMDLVMNIPMDNTISFKQLKLETGGIATDWTPAPEDTQSAIDTLTARVVALESK